MKYGISMNLKRFGSDVLGYTKIGFCLVFVHMIIR